MQLILSRTEFSLLVRPSTMFLIRPLYENSSPALELNRLISLRVPNVFILLLDGRSNLKIKQSAVNIVTSLYFSYKNRPTFDTDSWEFISVINPAETTTNVIITTAVFFQSPPAGSCCVMLITGLCKYDLVN